MSSSFTIAVFSTCTCTSEIFMFGNALCVCLHTQVTCKFVHDPQLAAISCVARHMLLHPCLFSSPNIPHPITFPIPHTGLQGCSVLHVLPIPHTQGYRTVLSHFLFPTQKLQGCLKNDVIVFPFCVVFKLYMVCSLLS